MALRFQPTTARPHRDSTQWLTDYLVVEEPVGQTLQEHLDSGGERLNKKQVLGLLKQSLGVLRELRSLYSQGRWGSAVVPVVFTMGSIRILSFEPFEVQVVQPEEKQDWMKAEHIKEEEEDDEDKEDSSSQSEMPHIAPELYGDGDVDSSDPVVAGVWSLGVLVLELWLRSYPPGFRHWPRFINTFSGDSHEGLQLRVRDMAALKRSHDMIHLLANGMLLLDPERRMRPGTLLGAAEAIYVPDGREASFVPEALMQRIRAGSATRISWFMREDDDHADDGDTYIKEEPDSQDDIKSESGGSHPSMSPEERKRFLEMKHALARRGRARRGYRGRQPAQASIPSRMGPRRVRPT